MEAIRYEFDIIEKTNMANYFLIDYNIAKIAKEKPTVKEIFVADVIEHKEFLEIVFIGDGFLKYQVRTMIGTLIDIATGKKDESIIDEIFETKNPELTNRVLSGAGLYLVKVTY